MANIRIKKNHTLSHVDARKRVQEIALDLKKTLEADYSWHDDTLKFKRSGASGSVELGEGFIEVRIKLGMLLVPMKGKIESTIRQRLDEVIGADSA